MIPSSWVCRQSASSGPLGSLDLPRLRVIASTERGAAPKLDGPAHDGASEATLLQRREHGGG